MLDTLFILFYFIFYFYFFLTEIKFYSNLKKLVIAILIVSVLLKFCLFYKKNLLFLFYIITFTKYSRQFYLFYTIFYLNNHFIFFFLLFLTIYVKTHFTTRSLFFLFLLSSLFLYRSIFSSSSPLSSPEIPINKTPNFTSTQAHVNPNPFSAFLDKFEVWFFTFSLMAAATATSVWVWGWFGFGFDFGWVWDGFSVGLNWFWIGFSGGFGLILSWVF